MSDKTNDEKLRILQERLAQIKNKKETPVSTIQQREKVIEITATKEEIPQKESSLKSFVWVKYFVISLILGFCSFYAYNNINFANLVISSKEKTEEPKEFVLKYNLNISGENIVIVASLDNESSAKALVNDLKVKGFKTDYFFLPNKSNSDDQIYQVFIGPYENNKEARQWSENLESDFNIIQL